METINGPNGPLKSRSTPEAAPGKGPRTLAMDQIGLTNVNVKTLLSAGPVVGNCAAPGCKVAGALPVFYFGPALSFGTCSVNHWNEHFAASFGSLENPFAEVDFMRRKLESPAPNGPRNCDNCGKQIRPYIIPAERQFCCENCAVFYHGERSGRPASFWIDYVANTRAGWNADPAEPQGPAPSSSPVDKPAPIRKLLINQIEAVDGAADTFADIPRCDICDAMLGPAVFNVINVDRTRRTCSDKCRSIAVNMFVKPEPKSFEALERSAEMSGRTLCDGVFDYTPTPAPCSHKSPEPVGPDSFGGSDFPESLRGTVFEINAPDFADEPGNPGDSTDGRVRKRFESDDPGDCSFCERPIVSNVFYKVGDAFVCSTTCRSRQMVSDKEKTEAETEQAGRRAAAIVRIVENWNVANVEFDNRRATLWNEWPTLATAIRDLATNSEPVE